VNATIELHDSEVAAIDQLDGAVTVHFSPAYLHKSEGRPGLDHGSGWVQNAKLSFTNGCAFGDLPELPCDVMSGEFVICGVLHDNEIPLPLDVAQNVELRLIFDSKHTVRITAARARLELIGEPRYVEEFNP
jgi:hypothetical protein